MNIVIYLFIILSISIIVILCGWIALVRKAAAEYEKIENLELEYSTLFNKVKALEVNQCRIPVEWHEVVDVSFCDMKINNVTLKELAEFVLFNKPIQRNKRTIVADMADKGIKKINTIGDKKEK